jgi:hypothetical protein
MSGRSYTQLEAAPVHATIARLAQRVEERFPDSGLSRVSRELVRLAEENSAVIQHNRRPLWWLRVAATATLAVLVGILVWAAARLLRIVDRGASSVAELLQGTDAAVNELIFLSLAAFFLSSLETRFKRRRALRMIHRLRGAAHVIDMHQLTKDPEQALHPLPPTLSSPERPLDRLQLARYLEYCSEMFALISKLAVLHAQHLQDPVVLEAVNDIESLTAGLSRKVWQKITILNIAATPGAAREAGFTPA